MNVAQKYHITTTIGKRTFYVSPIYHTYTLTDAPRKEFTLQNALLIVEKYKELPWYNSYPYEDTDCAISNGNIRRLNLQIKRVPLDTFLPRHTHYRKKRFVIAVTSDMTSPEWIGLVEGNKLFLTQQAKHLKPLTREAAMFVIQHHRRYELVTYKNRAALVNPRFYLKRYNKPFKGLWELK
jgi:hypothetical protein